MVRFIYNRLFFLKKNKTCVVNAIKKRHCRFSCGKTIVFLQRDDFTLEKNLAKSRTKINTEKYVLLSSRFLLGLSTPIFLERDDLTMIVKKSYKISKITEKYIVTVG